MLADEDRSDIFHLAEFAKKDGPNHGTYLTRLWAAFDELEKEHLKCLERQASVGLYLQHLRASVSAAKQGYSAGDEYQALRAHLADLERAIIGQWPIPHAEVESLVAEVEERDLPK